MTLSVTGDAEADELVRSNPLALLIAMLLDQQISIELAFRGPHRLAQRLGELSVNRIVSTELDDLIAAFSQKPALHRFPKSMAARTHALCSYLDDRWAGRAESLWSDAPDAGELFGRLLELPGFGQEKAMILTAVLAKRMGIAPEGWREFAGPFADAQPRSVADVDSPAAMERVKAWKKLQRSAGKTKQQ